MTIDDYNNLPRGSKIGLWSDSVNFPSLPLMKLSTWHKQRGDTVEMLQGGANYDRVYISKIFNLPLINKIPKEPTDYTATEVFRGGTGYAIKVENGREVFHPELHENLPEEIERQYPDYSLYPEFSDIAYGFLTRGCCNNCGFCIVCPKEGRQSVQVAELTDFWQGQKVIKLLDPNLFACKDRIKLLRQLCNCGAYIDFTQGVDARFVDDEVAELLASMKIKEVHFAFDFMKNEAAILRGLECFRNHWRKSYNNVDCYILTNYDTTFEQDWYRVRKVKELGIHPDVRIYQKGTHDRFLTDLSRWANNRRLYKSTTFENYIPRKDGKSCKELYPDILKGV